MDKKEVICFRKVIPHGTTVPVTISERVKDAGTVEMLRVRFYVGQQKNLQVLPYIKHKGEKMEVMISFPDTSDQLLYGDDDYFIFDLVLPVEKDDQICVQVVNNDAVNDYTLCVDIGIDYYGGTNRIIGGVSRG